MTKHTINNPIGRDKGLSRRAVLRSGAALAVYGSVVGSAQALEAQAGEDATLLELARQWREQLAIAFAANDHTFEVRSGLVAEYGVVYPGKLIDVQRTNGECFARFTLEHIGRDRDVELVPLGAFAADDLQRPNRAAQAVQKQREDVFAEVQCEIDNDPRLIEAEAIEEREFDRAEALRNVILATPAGRGSGLARQVGVELLAPR